MAYYIVYFQSERAFNIGFSLNMVRQSSWSGLPSCVCRHLGLPASFCTGSAYSTSSKFLATGKPAVNASEFILRMHSLERIQGYLTIEQEPKPTAAGVPPAYWPASGSLSVDSLSAKYSPDGPTVLHDISFNIKSGERVGVGKSPCIAR